MAVHIGCIHRRPGNIVRHNHIPGRSLLQNAQRPFKVPARNLPVPLKQHLRHLAPGCIGIAEVMLVEHIRRLIGLQHILGVAVRAKPRENPPVHQLHGGRAAAGIAHVGLRIVDHHGVRILNQVHLMGIDVNTVGQQRLVSQDIPVHQPVHNPLSVVL